MSDTETYNDDAPKCPYCGYIVDWLDACEFHRSSECADIECPSCEEEYTSVRHTTITYTAKKKEAHRE